MNDCHGIQLLTPKLQPLEPKEYELPARTLENAFDYIENARFFKEEKAIPESIQDELKLLLQRAVKVALNTGYAFGVKTGIEYAQNAEFLASMPISDFPA